MTFQSDCIFCKIARGEVSSCIIYEDEAVLGILDTNPCTDGHCLVIPKKHIPHFYEMDDEDVRIDIALLQQEILYKIRHHFD